MKKNPNRPKYTAKEILDIYLNGGCKSFATPNPDKASARRQKYCSTTLAEGLKATVGSENTMGQFLKPAFITAFDMETERPFYFQSWKHTQAKVWQVARATSAAPGLFKAITVDGHAHGNPLIDGSIFASNPAMCTYAMAHQTDFSKIGNTSSQFDQPGSEDMVIVSIGTGRSPQKQSTKADMIRFMMKNLMTAGTELVNQQLKQLFGQEPDEPYFRFNPILPLLDGTIDNVDEEQLKSLKEIGMCYLKTQEKEVERLTRFLLA